MGVLIKEQDIDVNIEEELEGYLAEHFHRHDFKGNKLQSCSPFRHEKTPSFAVNLDNGTWIDSGATDDEWKKGNFVKLLSFLMGVTYSEAEQFILEKYRTIYADVDNLSLTVQLQADPVSTKVLSKEELEQYMYRHHYLTNRGISEKVQRAFRVGYCSKNNAVVMAWMDKDGQVVNLKFRSVADKKFWYLKDGQPIKSHIFGLNFVYKMQAKTVVVVESETDCLYLWTYGVPAIALGSAHLSKAQEKLLINSPIETLILGQDDDKAGYACKLDCIKRLQGIIELWDMQMPSGCKDVNSIPSDILVESVGKAQLVVPSFL